ncbi:MAG: Flp family type IVb pilin [Minisyncoccales bacterium]
MSVKKRLREIKDLLKEKIRQFLYDEYGGSLVEYALIIGFAIFMFLILVGTIYSQFEWTLNQSNDFFDLIKDMG